MRRIHNWIPNAPNEIHFVMVSDSGVEIAGLGDTFDLELCKPGTLTFVTGAGAKDEVGSGWYEYISTAAEADTEGQVAIRVTGTGSAQQNLVYQVGAPGVWGNSVRTLTQMAAGGP